MKAPIDRDLAALYIVTGDAVGTSIHRVGMNCERKVSGAVTLDALTPDGARKSFVRERLREGVDVSVFFGTYEVGRGQPQYHPELWWRSYSRASPAGCIRRGGLRRPARSGWTSWP